MVKYLNKAKEHKKIILNTHPFIAAFLKRGIPSVQQKWFAKYKKWIKILPRDAYQYLRFDLPIIMVKYLNKAINNIYKSPA